MITVTATYQLVIPGWRPALTNELVGKHWTISARRKKSDRRVVGLALLVARVPAAKGKRRVGLTIRGRYSRFPDPDSPWKSLLDALVKEGALVDDSEDWCEITPPTFERGPRQTTITLEDIDA